MGNSHSETLGFKLDGFWYFVRFEHSHFAEGTFRLCYKGQLHACPDQPVGPFVHRVVVIKVFKKAYARSAFDWGADILASKTAAGLAQKFNEIVNTNKPL